MLMREEVIFEPPPAKLPVSFAKNGVKFNNVPSKNLNMAASSAAAPVSQIKSHASNNSNINVVRTTEHKTKSGACIKYVCSKVTLYYNSRIELKWRRALHHCQSCDFGVSRGESMPCGAIHYGMCLPVVDKYSVPRKTWQTVKRANVGGVSSGGIKTAAVGTTGKMVAGSPHAVAHTTHGATTIPSSNVFRPGVAQVSSHAVPSNVGHTTSPSSSHTSKIYIQTIANGKEKEKDTSGSVLKDIRDQELEKENTDINIQNNNLSQTFDHLSISTKESSRVKKKDNSNSRPVIVNANIPKFYFPMGRPSDKNNLEEVLQRASQEFSKFDDGKVHKHQMGVIAKTCGLPLYWKCPLFQACGGSKQGFITYPMFTAMYNRVFQSCHDNASRFIMLLAKSGTNYLDEDDVIPLIQDVVDTHPGLTFLLEAPEFHSRYVNTVVARIMYCVNRSWTGRITIQELRKSNLLRILALLEEEGDINQITEYFSYEHFYVIYCKFWELDKDHDLFIDKTDLARHNEHAISTRMLDRIFSGAVTRGKTFEDGKMSYPEFVWFLLSEEDKKHPTSVEYWFRCMDIDGDGTISMYEMEYFYEEQMQKMEALGIERLPFEDCLCQMLDLVQPERQNAITLKDLKRCKMTNIFFDTFMNLDKFLENEQRDPFANLRDLENDAPEPTDWEKYAAEEYEILVAEEGANEQEEIHYEDDFEPDDDDGNLADPVSMATGDKRSSDLSKRSGSQKFNKQLEDDIYDFSNTASSY